MSKTYFMARDRQYGLKPKLGLEDRFYKTLYSSMLRTTNSQCPREVDQFGATFNLEFSPESSLLISACEKRAFILWDPVSMKQVNLVENAHRDCVNCVKFIDRNNFATCSDDTTIALWDVRNLKNKIRTLNGHSNWVKSVEYDSEHGLLISAGFDGNVYTWSLNTYLEAGFNYTKLLRTTGLMRCQLSADASKLVMCTTGGFLIVVHNLDLENLANDLDGFKPNIFRLMQLGRQHIPAAAYYKFLFCKTRLKNRVELITDFPEDNDAEVISSVQIHPKNSCVFSRNISHDESSEWSCVHDIRTFLDGGEFIDLPPDWQALQDNWRPPQDLNQEHTQTSDLWEAVLTIRDQRTRRINTANRNTNPQHQFMHYIGRISSGLVSNRIRAAQAAAPAPADPNAPSTSGASTSHNPSTSSTAEEHRHTHSVLLDEFDCLYYHNLPRLVRYVPEANIGRGFIKESSFSPEGRVIASPFGYGVRILGFNEQCMDYATQGPEEPSELTSLGYSNCHKNIVICTKFSPRHNYFVSGCLNGELILHNPVL